MIILTMTSFLIISPTHEIHKTNYMSRVSSKWLILPVCVLFGMCAGVVACVCVCVCGGVCGGVCALSPLYILQG